MTPEEIVQITDVNDIRYKFDGEEFYHIIVIGTHGRPTCNNKANLPNDDEDRFLYLQSGLEYSTDEGQTWQDLTTTSYFTGDVVVWVRKKSAKVYLAGPHFVATFTQATDTPERRYLRLGGNVKPLSGPLNIGGVSTTYDKAIDSNQGTYWQNRFSSAQKFDDNKNIVPSYDNEEFIFEIGEPHYVSAIGYIPGPKTTYGDGTITECEVLISNDKNTWQSVGKADDWAYIKSTSETYPREQSLDFYEPAYAKYVKIKVVKAGTTSWNGAPAGYVTAAEFKLYENELCPQKDVAQLQVAAKKTNYKVGDRLDLDSITARLVYTDGTTSIIPASELEYSEDVFDSTDTKKVNASYKGVGTSFDVTVAANDRIATKISAVTVADRKYYAGDTFDKADVLVQVTDGTETWYLLPNEFNFENAVIAEGKHTVTVAHNELKSNFTINAEKAVKEIRIDTDENFKEMYYIGDQMDLSGMSVKLVYDDENEKLLTDSEYDLELTKDGNIPITDDIFARTAGTKTITVSLKNKSEISANLDVTVFAYINAGEFSFEALPGETTCKVTGFTPSGDISGRTVEIPETVDIGGYTYTVTEISGDAFSEVPSLEAVSIPKSVNTILTGAFSNCTELTKVYMTDHKTLDNFTCDDGAFAEVDNGYVYLGNSLTGASSPIKGYNVASIAQSATSIEVDLPTKTEYILGEELDSTGMVVTAVLPDGGRVNTNAYTMRGYSSLITGTQTITVTLDGSKLSKTFTVNVAFPEIMIEQQPQGSTYAQGDEMDAIKVTASTGSNHTLVYQWYRSETEEKNGTAINGATRATYYPEQAGYYYAAVYVKDKNNKMSEPVYSNSAHIMVGDYEAIIGTKGYASLEEAMLDAPKNSTIRVCKDIDVNETIRLEGKKFTIDGQGHILRRADGFQKSFIQMLDESNVTLKNITLDGGAVWTGEEDPIVKRGLTNSGLTATAPFVIEYGNSELTLDSGAVMQNNYNTSTIANNQVTDEEGKKIDEVTDNDRTGGAVWTINSTLTLNGGIIRNNASELFGSAAYMRGTSVLTSYKGEVTGHHAPKPEKRTTAVCTDNNTTVNIKGGTFSNNKGGEEGGVFWIGYGTIIISNGTFENNYSAGPGGVAYFYQGGGTSTLDLTGGTFRNNRAEGDGGVFYTRKNAKVSNAVFENNSSNGNGGVFRISNSGSLEMTDNKFNNNRAEGDGGAVWADNNVSTSLDAFVGNAAEKGSAIYLNGQRQLTVKNISDAVQDIYLQTFKAVKVTGMLNENKSLPLITESDIAADAVVAYSSYDIPADIRVNGYKTEFVRDGDGKLVYDNANKGYKIKAVINPRVTYNKDGGTIENEWQYTVYNSGTALTLPTANKNGYNFAGWFDNAELTGNPVTEIGVSETSDKEFWAKWTVADYSVTLNTNGGTLTDTLNKYTHRVGAELPVPTKDGYNFAGWFDNADCEGRAVTEITAEDFGDKQYWAKWAENGYSVTLNTNGGTLEEDLTSYIYGVGAELPVPTKDEHIFEGWFDNADCEGTPVTAIGVKELGNKEYWAKWKTNEYEIRFVNHDNRTLQVSNVAFGTRPEYIGQTPVKDEDDKYSYEFSGWSPDITAVTGEATYTAQFNAVPRTFGIMLNTDGGILENEYIEYTYGIGATLPIPTKDGFYFLGWYDNEELIGDPITAVSSEETDDKPFWAKWTEEAPTEYLITFVNYDNTELQSGMVGVGEMPDYQGDEPVRPQDDRYSYKFIGWDKEISEVTEMATYTAQFERTPIVHFVEYTNGKALIGSPEEGEYELIFAAYDLDGSLISVETVQVEFTNEYEQTIELQTLNTDGAAKVKVMLWDSLYNMTPKCKTDFKIITY